MTRFLLILLALSALAGREARAAESAAVVSSHTAVTLVSASDSLAPGQPFRLGLRFRMAPGWHIYWQNPGDAGLPPTVTWTLPAGATAGPIAWPTPARDRDGPLMSYVYTGSVLLPVTVTPAAGAGGPVDIRASADWLVCERVCVPESGTFHLTLPAGGATPAPEAALFAAADARRPVPSPFTATITPAAELVVTGAGLTPARVADAWFFPDTAGPIDQNAAQAVTLAPDRLTLRLKPGPQWRAGAPLAGVLVLRDGAGNQSALAVTAGPGAAPAPAAHGIGLGDALLLALAGGLVLNLMPCVFPVLVMKGLAIARLGGAARREVRLEALSYAAGIVLAFTALGGLLLVLRATGSAAGWGFQFQSPVFVVVTAWLLFAIGLNMSGLFEVGGGRLAGVGQGLASRGGHAGSFFTGLLAVLVATPCTAPFMGGAIAAALASPAPVALGIFACLGLGLAAPSVLLAAAPALAGALPRPGAWMEVLRQALAFPMYAAAIWLLWVAATQAGPTGVFVAAAGAFLLALGGWSYGRAQRARAWGRGAGRVVAAVAAVLALALLPDARRAGAGTQTAAASAQTFSDARLAALRAAGRPVFVDMTAAWCITCLVNERVALAPAAVQAAFASHQVAYLKGDWTRQDPEITAFLHAAGRDGVPLYVWYPAHGGAPVVLPQILTPGLVLSQMGA